MKVEEYDDGGSLLRTVNLKKYFPIRKKFHLFSKEEQRYVKAVDGISISIPRGRTVGVVGESGCGKTTLARAVALLLQPTAGEIYFDGRRIDDGNISKRDIYKNMQMIFQDPESSLDPRMKVGDSIGEPLRELMGWNDSEVKNAVNKSLAAVGLDELYYARLPRQLSGGQKQRVAIARAISPSPKLVILDEPTSALDASVQAQILALLVQLQRKYNLAYMLITHNMAAAKYLADYVAVMYSGNLVEYGPTLEVIDQPRHPYTMTLINSAPVPDPWKRNLLQAEVMGEVPSAINPPSGCRFNPRCRYSGDPCKKINPILEEIETFHSVACHFVEKTKKGRE